MLYIILQIHSKIQVASTYCTHMYMVEGGSSYFPPRIKIQREKPYVGHLSRLFILRQVVIDKLGTSY